jgi:hypothetical protein
MEEVDECEDEQSYRSVVAGKSRAALLPSQRLPAHSTEVHAHSRRPTLSHRAELRTRISCHESQRYASHRCPRCDVSRVAVLFAQQAFPISANGLILLTYHKDQLQQPTSRDRTESVDTRRSTLESRGRFASRAYLSDGLPLQISTLVVHVKIECGRIWWRRILCANA